MVVGIDVVIPLLWAGVGVMFIHDHSYTKIELRENLLGAIVFGEGHCFPFSIFPYHRLGQPPPPAEVQNAYSPSQSLALQALHMDMPHHLLLNKASKAPVTKGHPGPLAMPSSVLVGHDCKREKKTLRDGHGNGGVQLENHYPRAWYDWLASIVESHFYTA